MHRPCTAVLAAVCLLASGSAVRADQLSPTSTYSWGYQFQQGPDPVHTYLRANIPSFTTIMIPGVGSNSSMNSASGVPTTISTKVWTASTASVYYPQKVDDMPFEIKLRITDNSSGDSRGFIFRGFMNGDVWNHGSTLTPTFVGSLVRTVDLNHHIYTVTFNSFTSPGGNFNPGQFNFTVTVAHNPEPSTLILAGIGVPLLGLTLRRRRKKMV